MICTECGFRRDAGLENFCNICEKPLCHKCSLERYRDWTDDDEGLNCEGCECTACEKKRLNDARIARGEFTAAELEEQGQLNLWEEKP